MLTGCTSTPSDGATAWIARKLADAGGECGIPKDRRARHARRDLLEQFQPFAAQAVFELRETGGVAARPRQAVDEAGADRIDDMANTIGTVRVACSNAANGRRAMSQDDVRRERDQFRRALLRIASASPRPSG